jgi:hypothetical protein
MRERPEGELGIPWLDRCLKFAFPASPFGVYVSYDNSQEGESRQSAEAFS